MCQTGVLQNLSWNGMMRNMSSIKTLKKLPIAPARASVVPDAEARVASLPFPLSPVSQFGG